jgi:hypothetical protein
MSAENAIVLPLSAVKVNTADAVTEMKFVGLVPLSIVPANEPVMSTIPATRFRAGLPNAETSTVARVRFAVQFLITPPNVKPETFPLIPEIAAIGILRCYEILLAIIR